MIERKGIRMDLPVPEEHASRPSFLEIKALHPGWGGDFDSMYNFPFDSRKAIAVTAEISEKGSDISRISANPKNFRSNIRSRATTWC